MDGDCGPDGTAFRVAGPDIVFEDFDGETVVLNLRTGRYFGLNPAAAQIWDALVSGAALGDIAEALDEAIGLEEFVEKLLSDELLAVREGDPSGLPDDLRARLASSDGTPGIEAYDDLADLIVADPIHDTDVETGWPARVTVED